jgi:hypothetical protein
MKFLENNQPGSANMERIRRKRRKNKKAKHDQKKRADVYWQKKMTTAEVLGLQQSYLYNDTMWCNNVGTTYEQSECDQSLLNVLSPESEEPSMYAEDNVFVDKSGNTDDGYSSVCSTSCSPNDSHGCSLLSPLYETESDFSQLKSERILSCGHEQMGVSEFDYHAEANDSNNRYLPIDDWCEAATNLGATYGSDGECVDSDSESEINDRLAPNPSSEESSVHFSSPSMHGDDSFLQRSPSSDRCEPEMSSTMASWDQDFESLWHRCKEDMRKSNDYNRLSALFPSYYAKNSDKVLRRDFQNPVGASGPCHCSCQ